MSTEPTLVYNLEVIQPPDYELKTEGVVEDGDLIAGIQYIKIIQGSSIGFIGTPIKDLQNPVFTPIQDPE